MVVMMSRSCYRKKGGKVTHRRIEVSFCFGAALTAGSSFAELEIPDEDLDLYIALLPLSNRKP